MLAQKMQLEPVLTFPVSNSRSKNQESSPLGWSGYFAVADGSELGKIPDHQALPYVETSHELEDHPIGELSKLANTYMPISPKVQSDLDQATNSIKKIHQGRMLGVHYRGTDMFWHPAHPTPLTQGQLITVIKSSKQLRQFDSVYVATDTSGFIRRLKKELNIPIITRDSQELGVSDSRISDPIFAVLLDAWILSRCDGLVHTGSNVSWAARVFRGHEFDVRLELSLGHNPSTLPKSLARALWRRTIPDRFRNEQIDESWQGL